MSVMTTPQNQTENAALRAVYPWRTAFLAALRATATVVRACEAARVDRRWVYQVRRTNDVFRVEWDDALTGYADDLKAEAVRRAVEGTREFVLYQGKIVSVWLNAAGYVVPEGTPDAIAQPLVKRRYSDAVLLKLLAAARPEEFGAKRGSVAPPDPEAAAQARWEAKARTMTDEELDAAITRLKNEAAATTGPEGSAQTVPHSCPRRPPAPPTSCRTCGRCGPCTRPSRHNCPDAGTGRHE